jgi:outer membrane receptor protein involved in Fe transport
LKTLILILLIPFFAFTQTRDGSIEGSIISSSNNLAISGASIELLHYPSLMFWGSQISDKTGFFSFDSLPNGFFQMRVSSVGHNLLKIDSLYIYDERRLINLGELSLGINSTELETIVVYAEKPLIQTKEGNLIVNVAESPLSTGSNASDLLKSTPLVAVDPDGKITVRGKEPRILIDNKPVQLNGLQLSDFLESLPGGMIDKIEIMTNPPAQYANEPGGVINITTRKGKIGMSARTVIYGGTRGELGANASINFRRKGLSVNAVIGNSYNDYTGYGNGNRQNIYKDSTNSLKTHSQYNNINTRPNYRLNVDYDFNNRNTVNVLFQFNGNDFNNKNNIDYSNFNTRDELYKGSKRILQTIGNNNNPSLSYSQTIKGKKAGNVLQLFLSGNKSWQNNNRYFTQKYFGASNQQVGNDSTQWQLGQNYTGGLNGRINYDFPIVAKTTSGSIGGSIDVNNNQANQKYYYKLPVGDTVYIDRLSNNFLFKQRIYNFRASIRQNFLKVAFITGGINGEQTKFSFDINSWGKPVANQYFNWIPFGNLNINFTKTTHFNLSYRRVITRPGIRELNPVIDYSDAYTIRFGNPDLLASRAHNFDLVAGKTEKKYYINLGLGYNILEDLFAQVRTLIGDGKTTITFQNISGKKEYETSSWFGFQFGPKIKNNGSISYIFNQYSAYDIAVNKYTNGATINVRYNMTYIPNDLYNVAVNMGYNRYANPQGTVKSNVNMNFGFQRKLLKKKMTLTLNIIDPIYQQSYNNTTIGTNFIVQSQGLTQTRNYRLTMAYNFMQRTISSVLADKKKKK